MRTLLSIFKRVNCACCDYYFPPPVERTLFFSSPVCLHTCPSGSPASFSIDAIYTWVDGADPAHAAKRARYQPSVPSLHAKGETLFRDTQELRYSLRSLAQYAPWIRRVHLVTDGQRPAWLRSEHPGIQIVDHAEIIPPQYLPTFNSHVIEAFLHRIPGLAEHYLYFNDDFFLTAPAGSGDFFTPNGMPYLFIDWRESRRQGYKQRTTPHAHSWFNTRNELERRGIAPAPDIIGAHIPHAQTKSNAEAAFAFFSDAILAFSGNRFRTNSEMAFYSHAISLWAYACKKAIPCDVTYWYVNIKRKDRRQIYSNLLDQKSKGHAPLFLCLNDVQVQGFCPFWFRPFWRRHLTQFMEKYWPTPSPWEQISV